MIWWWVGNVVLFVVVIPLVLFLAIRVLRPVQEIKAYADDVLEHGVALTGTLDAVPKLVETRALVAAARQAVGEYGAAVGARL